MSEAGRPPTATLFAQLLALIVLSLVGALTINLLVVLNLPPPAPEFYRMAEIARVLKEGPGASTTDRRPLITHLSSQPPPSEPSPPGPFVPPARQALAALLGAIQPIS